MLELGILTMVYHREIIVAPMGIPSFFPVIPAVFILIIFVLIMRHQRRIARLGAMDYSWYRSTYPALVKSDSVECHSCGSKRIQVRGLMQQTYLREHVCTRCGTALYYSKERRG